jgi:hypothetical protein
VKISIFALVLALPIFAADPPNKQPTKAAPKAEAPAKPLTWTQEPDSFMGIAFNSSKAEATSLLSSRNEKFSGCISLLGAVGGVACEGVSLKLGSSSIAVTFEFMEDKFAQVISSFPSSDFETVQDVFVQRYGIPQVSTDDTVQTAGGSKYQNHTLEWHGKTLNIILEKYVSKVTEGGFVMTLHSLSEAESKAKEDAKKKAADKL